MKIPKLAIALFLFAINFQSADSQMAETVSPIKIENFEVLKSKLPNSKSEWTKLICRFSNSGNWMDGLSFNYYVLVKPSGSTNGEQYRLLTGGLTYMNVPKGQSAAIFYLSQNSTLRFGTPVAVKIEVLRGDRQIEDYKWTSGGVSLDKDWPSKYPPYAGILINVRATPWIFTDSELTPDLL